MTMILYQDLHYANTNSANYRYPDIFKVWFKGKVGSRFFLGMLMYVEIDLKRVIDVRSCKSDHDTGSQQHHAVVTRPTRTCVGHGLLIGFTLRRLATIYTRRYPIGKIFNNGYLPRNAFFVFVVCHQFKI